VGKFPLVHATAAVDLPVHDVFDPRRQARRDLRDAVRGLDQRVEVIVVEIGKGIGNRLEVSFHRAILRHG